MTTAAVGMHRPGTKLITQILLILRSATLPQYKVHPRSATFSGSSTSSPASSVLLFKGFLLSVINKLLQKCASVFVKSSPLTQLLPHQSILHLSSSSFSPKFYFLFHRPEHNITLFTTLLSQYPGIPCCLPIHTLLFSHIHQPLLIFQPLFSKPFYFFLPCNSHKRRPNPHRSPPVRTNMIRIHHSEHTVSFFITTLNSSVGTRVGPHVQLSQHDYPFHPCTPDWWPSQLPSKKSGLTAEALTQEPGNTSQRSTNTLHFSKVLLLQRKTILFQYRCSLLQWQTCLHTCNSVNSIRRLFQLK